MRSRRTTVASKFAVALAVGAVLVGAGRAKAQREAPPPQEAESIGNAFQGVFDRIWIPRKRYVNSPHLRSVFRGVVSDVRKATVEVRSDGRRVALGGLVGPDGWVVTKASRVRGPVTCRLRDGRELDAKLVGVDENLDLAMLKIAVKDAPTLELLPSVDDEQLEAVSVDRGEPGVSEADVDEEATTESDEDDAADGLRAGDWLATVGVGRDPISVGVLSVSARKVDKRRGFLGVTMRRDGARPDDVPADGVAVEEVHEGGAAAEAGLLVGDVIVAINGRPTPTSRDLSEAISSRNPGDRITVEVQRADERLRLLAMLHSWAPNPAELRAFHQNTLGGKLSERRFGFESVLQHDTVLRPRDCGGPIVDLDGRVVGFNIARAGRTESYALPADLVRDRLYELMSGRLAPKTAD